MSRLINRIRGRVHGWFDSKEARSERQPLPARFQGRARLALTNLEDRCVPTTFTVLNTNYSLAGSLRQAITDANAAAGPDTIVFDSSFSTGVNIIALATALPTISGAAAGNDLTITGPGADHLVITRAAAINRPFLISPATAMTTTISGMTITGFSGTNAGGAIGVTTATTLVLDGVQFIGNTSSATGGAIDINAATDLTIRNSLFAYNYGSQGGAIELRAGATKSLVIENSTIAFNTAHNGAGGIQWAVSAATPTTTITNCTITGNTSYNSDSNLGIGGGGLANSNPTVAMTLSLNSTILAGNYAYNGRSDASFGAGVTVNAQYNLIGVADTFTFNNVVPGSNKTGTQAAPLSANLGGFVRSSGSTFVIRPNAGSPAINNGDPTAPLATDQRGLPRVAGNVDIGAVEIQSPAAEPANSATTPANVTVGGGADHTFTITYQLDGGNIDFSTLGTGDIVMLAPTGATSLATFVSAAPAANASTIVATYKVDAPGGTWDIADYGTYTIILAQDEVKTAGGASLNPGILGSFNARVGTTYTVTSTADTATGGTLREAITLANTTATLGTQDKIVFDASVFGTPQTILLTAALPTIADSVDIVGPGPGLVTLQRSTASSTFTFLPMNKAIGNAVITISDVNLKGSTTGSPLITTADEWVTLTNVNISGNTVSTATNTIGGQIMAGTTTNSAARLTLNNCTIINSRVTSTAGTAGANGGAILMQNGGTLTLNSCTIENNTASGTGNGVGQGGGIAFTNTTGFITNGLFVTNSTISGNTSNNGATAGSGGGGVFFNGAMSVDGFLIRNSTIANNVAASGTANGGTGGGVVLRAFSGVARIQNSTITGNVSTNTSATPGMGGGGVAFASINGLPDVTGTLFIESTIISGNTSTASNGHDDFSLVVAANVSANSSYNAIGDPDGFTLASSTKDLDTANSAIAMLKLGPLAVTGPGTTKTRAVQIGSTAINAGFNASPVLTLDQTGNPRVQGPQIDIGSTEHIFGPPSAVVGTLPNVNADLPANNPYQFTITYTAEALMKRATIGDALEVQVTPTAGTSIDAVFVTADSAVDAQIITATYKILPPGGTWDGADNNTYTVSILGNSVFDTDNLAVVANPSMGSFVVTVPTTFTVTNTNDSGPGSLRNAIFAANSVAPTADIILFDATVFATPQTITLAGEVLISDGVTITGPAGHVTLSGGGVNRIFTIDGPGTITVSLSNLNLTNTSASTRGGAITITNEAVTLTDCSISNSTSSTNAGAFSISGGTIMTLIRSSFTNNKGTTGGVADVGSGNGTVIATDCTFSGNVATAAGGVFAGGFPNYTFTNCTFTGNSAATTGGAIQFANGNGAGGVLFSNCTLSGNTAASGGAINVNSSTYNLQVRLRNSTITGNLQTSATGNGGGIFWSSTNTSARLTLNSTIVAGNLLTNASATASPDIRFNSSGVWSAIQGDNNLIGVSEAGNFTLTGNNPITPGTKAAPVNPLLLPLAHNGGLTQTHALIPGVSPTTTIDTGNNIAPALTTDQRGGTFLREENGLADIGAFERVQGNPLAVPATLTPVTPGSLPNDPYTFTVTYANEAAFDSASFGNDDILVTGPNGYSKFATKTAVNANATYANGTDVTYTIPAPTGGWVGVVPNLYTVTVQGGSVLSTNTKAVPATEVGKIAVQLPAIFAVINTNDSGAGSLRQAILDANSLSSTADTIVFALPTFASAQTITLSGGEIAITDSLTIQGTGANLLTVSGNNASRIFNIGNAASLLNVTIQGMKLTSGITTGAGGAILSANEIFTLDRVWITGNSAATGGGVNMNVAGGMLTIRNSTLSGNTATTHGGGVYLQCQTTATTLSIVNSTISTNSAANLGGGVCLSNSGANSSITLQNSTFAGNTATTGGGFRAANVGTVVSVESTIFDGNVAPTGPSLAIGTVNSSHSALGEAGSFVQGTSDTDIPTGTVLNLGTLQDNGGAMPTHLPGNGSPLINAGSNPTSLTVDQRGLAREVGIIDIGAVEVQSIATPTVTGFTVNDGAAQRSRLTTITVSFSGSVNPASFATLGAMTLTRTTATATGVVGTIVQTGAAGANGLITVTQPGPANQLVLTFSNADSSNETAGVEYGSLTDGRWQLAVPSAGGYQSTLNDATLRRLFGDFETGPGSNGTVDGNDFATFGGAFGSSGAIGFSPFDYDDNGTIDSVDLGAVGARFGFSV